MDFERKPESAIESVDTELLSDVLRSDSDFWDYLDSQTSAASYNTDTGRHARGQIEGLTPDEMSEAVGKVKQALQLAHRALNFYESVRSGEAEGEGYLNVREFGDVETDQIDVEAVVSAMRWAVRSYNHSATKVTEIPEDSAVKNLDAMLQKVNQYR